MNLLSRLLSRRRHLSCHQVAEVLQSYLDGEVDDLTGRRIAHHLEDCRRCGLELDVYRSIKQSLATRADVDDASLERLRGFGRRILAGPDGLGEEPGG